MNVGDVVKITDKKEPELWCSGVVTDPETEASWAVARTMSDRRFVIDLDYYKVRVIRAVEPTEIGSKYKSPDGPTYIKIGSTSDDWIMINPKVMALKSWSEITGYSE
jgi:hypothetical protein